MNDQNHAGLMDNIYKSQRHIYDITRKYYLLGRDQLLKELKPEAGQTVLEVGCGTGRNLMKAAQLYPDVRFYGFDISEEMLITARKNVDRAGLSDRITLTQGDASDFADKDLFEIQVFDRVFYSYTLSMIPPWQQAIRQGILVLAPAGSLHIVDFGQQERLPAVFRTLLMKWLAIFHVEPRIDLQKKTMELASLRNLTTAFIPFYRGYAWSLILRSNS